MKKAIQILSGYSILFCAYAVFANFSLVGEGVKMTSVMAWFTCLALTPVAALAILAFLSARRK